MQRQVLASGAGLSVPLVTLAFGLAWATDATLKWLPGFTHGAFLDTLRDARDGQPSFIRAWINLWVQLFTPQPQVWAYLLAGTETLIAICLILGALTNAICWGGGVLSLLIWTTAEGFGGPLHSGSSDISVSIIYVMVFALLGCGGAGARWGCDTWLRPRLGRFGFLCSRTQALS